MSHPHINLFTLVRDHPVALNNLAHVLLQQGKLDEAEQTAIKAVAAGGHIADTAKETLAEIRAELARNPR